MPSNPHNSFFPFEEFIDKLRENGFQVGVHTYLHVQTLVNQLAPDTPSETLKNLLAPLFAKNEREQIKFYRLFDSYFRLVNEVNNKVAGEVKEVPEKKEPKKKKKRHKRSISANRWIFLTVALLFSAFFGYVIIGGVMAFRGSVKEGSPHAYLQKYQIDNDGRYFYHLLYYTINDMLGREQICDNVANLNFDYIPNFREDGKVEVQFNDSSISSEFSRVWDFGNGDTLIDTLSPFITYQDTGIYDVGLIVTNDYGCVANTRQLIHLYPPKTCKSSFEAIVSAENDLEVIFNDTSKAAIDDPIIEWEWAFGDDLNSTASGSNPVHTYRSYREYRVCLTIKTEKGCEDTYCKVVYLKNPDKVSELINLPPRPTFPINIEPLKTSKLAPLWPFIRFAIAVLIIFLLLFFELYKKNRRQLSLTREKSTEGPYNWPLTFPNKVEIYPPQIFHKVATHLRQRQESEIMVLDMDETIDATLNAGGFPTFKYTSGTRPSEYLILIERSNFKDHQARLFWLLIEKLGSQDIFIDVYFYQSDFRMYWKELDEKPLYLNELKVRHPGHRVIILGDGEHLLDPVYGDLNVDTFEFLEWKDRAVLTPIPPSEWSLQEVNLAKNFYVLPSTTESLSTLLTYFESEEKQRIGQWKKTVPFHPSLPEFDEYFDIDDLKTYLGSQAYLWVCACAVYPELHWDMTLHLGTKLSEGRREEDSLVNEPNLLRIVRIPWFKTGSIPEEIREALVDDLAPETEEMIRHEIKKILEHSKPPPGSYAAEKHEMQMTIQNWQLEPETWSERMKVGEKMEEMVEREEINDVTVLRHLKSKEKQRFGIAVPNKWRNMVFRKGMPVLGIKSWVRWAIAFPIILTLLWPVIDFVSAGNIDSIQDLKQLVKKPDNFVEINDNFYKLDNAEDSARYFAWLGTQSYNQGDFGTAYNHFTDAIYQNRFQPEYYYERGLANYQLTRTSKIDSVLLDTYKDFVRAVSLRPLFKSDTKAKRDTTVNLELSSAIISADGEEILTNSGNSIHLYSRDSLKLLKKFPIGGVATAVKMSKNSDFVLSAIGNNAQIHSLKTGGRTGYFSAHKYPINAVGFSPNEQYIVTGADDNLGIIWNRNSQQPIHYLEHIHSGPVLDAAFSPDNRLVVTASADSTAAIWNRNTGQLVRYLVGHEKPIISASFSPDSRLVLTVSKDGTLILWDQFGIKRFTHKIFGETLRSASFAGDGSVIFTVGERNDYSSQTLGFYSFQKDPLIQKINIPDFQTNDRNRSFGSISNDGTKLLFGVQNIGLMTFSFNPETFDENQIKQFSQFNRSVINYERELFTDAIFEFTELINQDPGDPDALYGRGLSHLYKSQRTPNGVLDTTEFRIGLEDLNQVMELDREYFDSIYSLLPFLFQFYSKYDGLGKYVDQLCMITQVIDSGSCELFRYQEIMPYSDGLAAVRKDKYWGYIDSMRNLIIPFDYEEAGPFKSGLAVVKLPGENTLKIINADNLIAYDYVGKPSEGLSYVRDPRTKKYGFIDIITGEEVIKLEYESAENFVRGYAKVSQMRSGRQYYGFIDKTGSADTYNGFKYLSIMGDFKNQTTVKTIMDYKKEVELQYIAPGISQVSPKFNSSGDSEFQEQRTLPTAPNMPFEIVGDLSNGLIKAKQNGKYGYVAPAKQYNPYVQQQQQAKQAPINAGNSKQEPQYTVVIQFQYDAAYDFSYERAAVKQTGGDWGFIDTYGKNVIPFKYKTVEHFSLKDDKILALIDDQGSTYYIDRAGECVPFGKFSCPAPDMRTTYRNELYKDKETGLIVFQEAGKWGLRKEQGEIIVRPIYQNRITFQEGLARVEKDDKWGFINRAGQIVIPINFDGALDFSEGLAAVQRRDRWGYIDKKGKIQINFNFSLPGKFINGWAVVKEGKISFKINKRGDKGGSRRK